jgi:aryl-alcohol dehydrogenase-like predicted oxidoreductase
VTVYNPLASGLLTGKHQRSGPVAGSRLQVSDQYRARYWRASHLAAVDELGAIARQAGKTPVQLALQWLAAQPAVDSIIIGVSSLEQLEENVAAWEGEVDAATLAACDRVWQQLRGDAFQYNR